MFVFSAGWADDDVCAMASWVGQTDSDVALS